MEVKLTNNNFEEEVINTKGKVLVDFWADWCGPCKMLAPHVEEFAEKHSDIKVGKVNIDEERDLAIKYQIMSIPTVILFEDGKPVRSHIGFTDLKGLEQSFM